MCVAAFCVAVSNAHTEVVETLLQLGADPNLGDRENVTPLIGAAQSGRRTICELCLEAEADVDKVDKYVLLFFVTFCANFCIALMQFLAIKIINVSSRFY